ncbi:MAG: S8 family serine peptidase [Candidatus Aminicenantes bacterium]|jgi:hypothetical protein
MSTFNLRNDTKVLFLLLVFFFSVTVCNVCATEEKALKKPDLRIKLKTHTFDPMEKMPDLRLKLQAKQIPKGTVYRIIQFKRPLTRRQVEMLKAQYGLKLDHYIPNCAFLEKISQEKVDRIKKLEFFRWAGLYQPEYKIDPGIGKRKFVSKRRKEEPGILLVVMAFKDSDAKQVAAAIAKLGFEVVTTTNEPEMGILRFTVRVTKPEDAGKIAGLPGVRYIEELGDVTVNNGTTTWVLQTNTNGSRTVWDHGLRGENQIIGHIDGLIDMNHCFFEDNTDNTIRFDHRKVVGLRNAGGHIFDDTGSMSDDEHGTFSAANAVGEDFNNDAYSAAPNANNGNAPRARLSHGYLYDLDLVGGPASFYNYLYQAYADGAFIHTNSWDDKSTSDYTQLSVDLDRFVWEYEDNLVIIGPDNNGTIRPPDTSKNALVVNSTVQNQGSFSSGITEFTLDGRRKPDLMAPGANIVSAHGGTACGTFTRGGTSFAAPAVAGTAALVRQYYTEGWYPSGTKQPHHAFTPSGALLKATLLNGTVDATGIAGYPDTTESGEGWGRLLLENSLFFDGDTRNLSVWDVRHVNGLYAGGSHNYHFTVVNNAEPLKITLVWNEPPASAGSATPVINDLDLVVIGPDNVTTYLGNDINANIGQSIANGGTNDTLNNVEMVILDNPPIGTYTLTVQEGTAGINQGPQGYALVATGDNPEPPVPTGNQNILVVRVGLKDILAGAEPPLTTVQNIMTEVINYFATVSYNGVTLNPEYPPPVLFDQPSEHPSTYYYHPSRNVLIELTGDVIEKLIAANADVFDKGTPATADDIDRMIIVLNDQNFTGDWATTGPWPYDLPGGLTRRISVSIHSIYNDPEERFEHGLGHQFGLVDLYAHPNVVFAQPHVDMWDNMATPFNGSDFMAWSKERATWITHHGSNILYIPRPGAGASYNNTIGINFLSSTNTDTKAIAIGLTEGAADIEDEDVFYFIEARTNNAGGPDSVLPEEGVLLYKVNENIPHGEGPVKIIDDEVSTPSLADAALEPNDFKTQSEAGLTVTIQDGTVPADRDIQISYDPPETDNDVNIRVGDPSWTSLDIWIDSPKDGFDEDEGRIPMDRGDQPVTGDVNRLYVRVHNPGPDDAYDFTIYIRVSEPYHTVGGKADFNKFVGQIHVPVLRDEDSPFIDYVEWTPAADDDPHSCVWVEIPNVFNDMNTNNNAAQQNLQEVASSHGSPYEIVTYRFGFTNPEDNQELFYFRAEGVPVGWIAVFNPKKALLSAHQRIECSLTIQPPDDAPVCTEHKIRVTSWMPRGDTLVQVGGGTVQVDLRNRTDLVLDTTYERCTDNDDVIGEYSNYSFVAYSKQGQQQQARGCMVIKSKGCTNPPRPFEEIILRYETPSGYPIYRTVITDEYGCYSDDYTVVEGGNWGVTAEYPGNDCSGPATTQEQEIGIPIQQTGDQDGDGVVDGDEPQGDHDRDGNLGIFDTDSDNDGIIDGEEPPGDLDGDGHDNIVDPDSDGDGIIDGQDPNPYGTGPWPKLKKLFYSFHIGSTHPLGNLNKEADANIHFHFDFHYKLTEQLNLKLIAGINQFTEESFTGFEHPRWINISLNFQAVFPTGSGLGFYLQGGLGGYWPKSGSSNMGLNFGSGAHVPLGGPFKLSFGVDYHRIFSSDPIDFLTLQMGILFK